MSENNSENNTGRQTGVIPEAQRQALHIRESICDELAALPQKSGSVDYPGEINRLCAAYAAAEAVAPEFAEVLDKKFSRSLEIAKSGEAAFLANEEAKKKLAVEVESLLAAGDLATLKEIEALEKKITTCNGGDTLIDMLKPLKDRLVAEADALAALGEAVQKLTDELIALTAAEDIAPLHERKPEIEAAFAGLAGAPRQAVQRYQEAHRKASVKLAQHYETLDLARWESYTLKLDICAELEKLCELSGAELGKISGKLNEIRDKWKQLGSVPKEKSEEINPRYLELTRKLQHRIDEFYACKRQEQKIASAEKEKLCVEAEAMAESTDWSNTSAKYKELQNQWKSLPRAGNHEADLFARFHAACDKFFTARKAVYDERDRQFDAAAKRKRALIAEAQNLTDIRRAKQLRDEYRNAGAAGREEKALYKEFNDAMNNFFNGRQEEMAAKEKQALALVAEVETLCENALNNKARVAEIKEELHRLACRDTRSAEFDAFRKFEAAVARSVKEAREQKIRESGDVAMQLAMCYTAYKNGETAELPAAEKFTGFQKLQSAAVLLSQALAGDEKAVAKLEKHVAQALAEREAVCCELENAAGMGKAEAAPLSLAQELEAAIMGNFAAKEAAVSKNVDPHKLLSDFAAAGLVGAAELSDFQNRIASAAKVLFKEK